MTLTYQEWALKVQNLTHPWTYETFPGDLVPPPGPVWIHADDFSLEWGFDGDGSPGPLEAATFQFSLSCDDAADTPALSYGDELTVTLSRPNGTTLTRNPSTGVVSGTHGPNLVQRLFWVTDITAAEAEAGRMKVSVTATGAIADVTLDVRTMLQAFGESAGTTYADWQAFSNAVFGSFPNMPEAVKACAYCISGTPAGNPGPWSYSDNSAAVGSWRGSMHKIGETISLQELLDDTHALAMAPPGTDPSSGPARPHGFALVWDTGHYIAGGRNISSYMWDPESAAPHAAAWQLTYISSVLDAALKSGFTPAAGGSTVGIVSACMISAGPNWRKDAVSSVGTVEYKGQARIAGSPGTDAETGMTSRDNSGPAVRSIESQITYVRNTVEPTTDFDTYGGRRTGDNIFLADTPAANGWVPESFDVLPEYMTDAEYAVLGPLFWPTDQYQISLVLVDLDPDTDMAAGAPVWLTLTGCKFTIDDGHLVMSPAARPFVPAAVTGVTDSVTWTQLNTAYPSAHWSQVADGFTWAQMELTSI